MDDVTYSAQVILLDMIRCRENFLYKGEFISSFLEAMSMYLDGEQMMELIMDTAEQVAQTDPNLIHWLPVEIEVEEEELSEEQVEKLEKEPAQINPDTVTLLNSWLTCKTLSTIKDAYHFLLDTEFTKDKDFSLKRKYLYLSVECFEYLKKEYEISTIQRFIKVDGTPEPVAG